MVQTLTHDSLGWRLCDLPVCVSALSSDRFRPDPGADDESLLGDAAIGADDVAVVDGLSIDRLD
ncbi:hypothetical protein [Natronococcus wangiae]|uniref:hypothetical protein n=1 Tax=Natronococcus wangiae TaxID=3068275 RepID=UPI00273EEFE0|nr:hypothetical protein [Natronococcus sp. AD5]